MKAFIASALFIALVSLAGCDNKEGIEPNVENQETKQIAQEVETGVVGEFKLVKVEGSASVFVLKDGKISPITNWNWVERNAPNKTIETVTKSEMDSFAVSDIIYK